MQRLHNTAIKLGLSLLEDVESGISDSGEQIFDLQCPRITVRGSQIYEENRIVEIRLA